MDKVRDWLASINLYKYGDIFEEKGWDDMDTVTTMSENDIQTVVTKPGHVRKITVAITKLKDQEKFHNVQENLPEVTNLPEVQKLPKVQKLPQVKTPHISSIKDDITGQNSKTTIQKKHQPIKTNQDADIQGVSICTVDNTGFVNATLTKEKQNDIANPNKETELQTRQEAILCDSIETVCTVGNYRPDHEQKDKARNDVTTNEAADRFRGGVCALSSVSEIGDISDSDDEISEYSSDVVIQLPSRHVMTERKDPLKANMSAFSFSSITTSTIVKDSKNVTIADKVEVHKHTDGSQDNFKGQINSVIRNYQRTEHLFVKTRSFNEVSDILEDRNVAIIVGNPGYGKSTMAYHQMLEHLNIGYEPIIVTSIADWKSMIEGKNKNKQIVVIDDIFGSLSVDERMLSKWSKMFDLIEKLVRERKGSLKVICTTRKYIMSQVFTKLKRYKIFGKLYTVDMADDQFKLLQTEKNEMLTKYFQHYKIEIQQTFINNVLRVASDYGFPHCVDMYCTRATLKKRGVAFFETPLEFLEKEIDNLVENEKDSFCSLLMVLLSEDKGFNITDLDNSDTDNQTIYNALKLSRMPDNTFLPGFVNVFKLLKDVFIKEIDDVYTFKHDSFKEIISIVTFKFHPATSMQLLSLKTIVEKTKYFTYKPSSLEMAAILPKSCTSNLIKRFNDEIEEGNGLLVSKHHAWNENDFIQKWFDTIKGMPKFIVMCFQTSLYQEKLKLGFLSCLCKNKKDETVLSLFLDKELRCALQHTDLVKELSIALVYASDVDCSEELLDSLIENGADVNGTFTDNLHVLGELFESSILAFELIMFVQISTALGRAICCDNLEKCRYLIDKGASLFNLGFQGRNIIHIAADEGSTKCLQYILNYVNSSKIPRVSITTNDFKSIECLYGERYSTYFCNSYAHGFPSGFVFFEYGYHSSVKAIHCIQTPEIYEILSKEHEKVEPIYSICLPNQHKGISFIHNGPIPQPEVYYEHSRMPMLIYLFLNHRLTPELINTLVERGHDVNKKYRDKSFMFFEGMTNNLDYPNDCITLLPTLYSHGLDINTTDRFGKTAMSFILSDNTDDDTEVCEWLLEMNADVNIPDNKGCVPLFYALEMCPYILLELLERTEHVGNLISHNGRTCFHYLAGNCEINTQYVEHIIPLLLKENIDINHLDNKGISALTLTNKNTIGPFLKHGAYPNIKDDNGMTPGMHLVLNASESSKYNGPPPRYVFFHAHDDLYLKIQILLKHGMHVSAKDSRERNILHYILQSDLKDSLKVEVVDLLSRNSCEINEKDDTGIVPIMLAVRNQTCGTPLFNHLVERGANVSHLDNNGQSVLDHCLEGSMEDIQKSEFIKRIISTKGFIGSYITSIPYALTEHNKIHTLCTFFNCVCLTKQNIGHVLKQILTSQIADDLKAMVIKICMDNSEDSSFLKDEIESNLLKTILKSTILLKVFIRYDLINLDMYSSAINLEMLPNEDENANEVLNILEEKGVSVRKHLSCSDDTLVEIKLVKEGKYTTFKSMLKYWDENKALCQDSKGNTVLHYLAIAKAEDSIVKDIVEQICQKTEIQTIQNKKGETALHVLCQTKPFKQETISLLIRHSQAVNTKDNLGKSALHHLIKQNVYISESSAQEQDDVLTLILLELINHKADVDQSDKNKMTPVMYLLANVFANRVPSSLDVLLSSVTDCLKTDSYCNTLLHYVCGAYLDDNIKHKFVQILIKKGTKIDAANKQGLTPDDMCRGLCSIKSVCLLQENDTHIISYLCECVEFFAEIHKHPEELTKALNQTDLNANTPSNYNEIPLLSQCCRFYRDVNIIKVLLKQGANPDLQDKSGYTSIHWLLFAGQLVSLSVKKCYCFQEDIREALLFQMKNFHPWELTNSLGEELKKIETGQNDLPDLHASIMKDVNMALEILHMLLSNKADPNIMDNKGRSPLHYCAMSPVIDGFTCLAMKLLIRFGADVNLEDYNGQTPHMLCAEFEGTKHRRMNILIEAGANLLVVDYNGKQSPCHTQVCIGKLVQKEQFESGNIEDEE